jgi:hypothetical protein
MLCRQHGCYAQLLSAAIEHGASHLATIGLAMLQQADWILRLLARGLIGRERKAGRGVAYSVDCSTWYKKITVKIHELNRGVTMTWINPLDRLPQIRSDYANHIAYGGFTGYGFLFLGFSPLNALLISLTISATKKIVDYWKENESFAMCFAKTVVTVIFPFAAYLYSILK